MNKKGVTLIEMVVAIMILSIAGMMILSEFTTVIHFIGKAADIKNQSDTLYSYAEETEDGSLRGKVEKKSDVNFTYTIKNDSDVTTTVTGTKNVLNVNGKSEVYLKTFQNNIGKLVNETSEYIDAISFANELVGYAKEFEKQYDAIGQDILYNGFIKNLLLEKYNNSFKKFNSILLPNEYKGITQYIRVLYPWDYYKGFDTVYGGRLIYLSSYSAELDENGYSENLHFVYDYDGKNWYYNPQNNISVTFSLMQDFDDGTGMTIDGNTRKVLTWEEFKTYIKNPMNGWKILDEIAAFDSSNANAIWKDVL